MSLGRPVMSVSVVHRRTERSKGETKRQMCRPWENPRSYIYYVAKCNETNNARTKKHPKYNLWETTKTFAPWLYDCSVLSNSRLQRPHINFFEKFIIFRGPYAWSSLPIKLKDYSSLEYLKVNMR